MKATQAFIVEPETGQQEEALIAFAKALKIKFHPVKKEHYDPDFVEKINKGRIDAMQGKGRVVTLDELDNLWK